MKDTSTAIIALIGEAIQRRGKAKYKVVFVGKLLSRIRSKAGQKKARKVNAVQVGLIPKGYHWDKHRRCIVAGQGLGKVMPGPTRMPTAAEEHQDVATRYAIIEQRKRSQRRKNAKVWAAKSVKEAA
jgi:hypothetical protein